MDPKQYEEFVDHSSDMDAHKLALDSNDRADILKEQSKLEYTVNILAHKISVLEKLLETNRAELTKAAIEAAKHRQKVLDLYMPKVNGDKDDQPQ